MRKAIAFTILRGDQDVTDLANPDSQLILPAIALAEVL
jgi:hypothetical protein